MHYSEPLDGVYVFLCNYSCLIGTFTKAVIYTVVKMGGGMGQDPATEVTHLRLNQPPVFSSSVPKLFSEYSLQSKNVSVILISNVFWLLTLKNWRLI